MCNSKCGCSCGPDTDAACSAPPTLAERLCLNGEPVRDALLALVDIAQDGNTPKGARITAATSILDFAARMVYSC